MTNNKSPSARPDIYEYHDYRQFLKHWFIYLKQASSDFSVRNLARLARLSESYLSMILSGERRLSFANLDRISGHIGLDASERSYLGWLRAIVEADDEEERLTALKKIQRFR